MQSDYKGKEKYFQPKIPMQIDYKGEEKYCRQVYYNYTEILRVMATLYNVPSRTRPLVLPDKHRMVVETERQMYTLILQ